MATKAQVERTLKDLLKRLNGADVGDLAVSEERIIVAAITDLELYYRGTFSGGRVGGFERDDDASGANVLITVSSDDLVALSEGRLSPVFAFLTGKLRVDANARDMLLLRQLF
ncbi:MAG: SCP2 sterol-binding domain-containing protein [Actinomycetota bacterium]|nr:SCP2 sterol-binding domain-containing protein [Actinomycetota bacterium]